MLKGNRDIIFLFVSVSLTDIQKGKHVNDCRAAIVDYLLIYLTCFLFLFLFSFVRYSVNSNSIQFP